MRHLAKRRDGDHRHFKFTKAVSSKASHAATAAPRGICRRTAKLICGGETDRPFNGAAAIVFELTSDS
jgi:hypothetical protein